MIKFYFHSALWAALGGAAVGAMFAWYAQDSGGVLSQSVREMLLVGTYPLLAIIVMLSLRAPLGRRLLAVAGSYMIYWVSLYLVYSAIRAQYGDHFDVLHTCITIASGMNSVPIQMLACFGQIMLPVAMISPVLVVALLRGRWHREPSVARVLGCGKHGIQVQAISVQEAPEDEGAFVRVSQEQSA
jgi:hypothetical protein